jgi:uncharacterized protein (DUF1330 family)
MKAVFAWPLLGMALGSCSAPTPRPTAASSAAALCSEPVLLVVWIDGLDRSKSGAYGQALRSSQIVKRNGGRYLAVSPPELMLEGDWPADRGFVIEEYPCIEAFRSMWYSEEYQKKIKPLREGSGTYTIGLFKRYKPAP